MDVEFYSLSSSFYFTILCYTEQKYICLCGGMQFQDLNAKKFQPAGDGGHLKVHTLKVKQSCWDLIKKTGDM
jgi:hypothetical protein